MSTCKLATWAAFWVANARKVSHYGNRWEVSARVEGHLNPASSPFHLVDEEYYTLSTSAMSNDVIIETEDLTMEFVGFVAGACVSLRLARGTRHALIGPNGPCKTTCFNLLSKFLTPTRGRIVFKGSDITA